MKKRIICAMLTITIIAALLPLHVTPASAFDMSKVGQNNTFSASYEFTAVIKTDGSLWMWGENRRGQLGDGTTDASYLPEKIMDNVAAVSTGMVTTAAIKTDGSLWMWGYGEFGQLGVGLTGEHPVDSHIPVKVMDNVAVVSVGYKTTAAIKTDGSLWAWGNDDYGLGIDKLWGSYTPEKIMDNVAAVSVGYETTAVIKTDGSLWMWGHNEYGQLGDGTISVKSRHLPAKVMDNVTAVSAGLYTTAAIKTDGSLWAWGDDSECDPHDETTKGRYSPVKIMDNVAAVSVMKHTMVIKKDGSLWTWGDNYRGTLGDGTSKDRSSPEKVMDNVAAVSAGVFLSMAIKTDGSLWAWGEGLFYLGLVTIYGYEIRSPVRIMDGMENNNKFIINPDDKYPIIVIPGIMGSRLFTDDSKHKLVWPPPLNLFKLDVLDNMPMSNRLAVIPATRVQNPASKVDIKKIGTDYPQGQGSTVPREYGSLNTYKNLIDRLCDVFPDRNVYFFSYDFRQGNEKSARELNALIETIKDNEKVEKVDIVAHSMGGLVASHYVALETNNKNNINTIITLGTPFEGAPKLLQAIMTEKLTDKAIKNQILQDGLFGFGIFGGGLTPAVKKQFPGAAELSPTKDYFNKVRVPFRFSDGRGFTLDNYSEFLAYLFNNSFNSADAVFAAQAKIKTETGANILSTLPNAYFIIGMGKATINSMEIKRTLSADSSKYSSYSIRNVSKSEATGKPGDGTVPYLSATMNGLIEDRVISMEFSHAELAGDDSDGNDTTAVLNKICEILKDGQSASNTGSGSADMSVEPYVSLVFACPVDVTVTKDGKTLATGENDVSDADFGEVYYLGENNEIKQLFLPVGEYDVTITGTGEGTMEYSLEYYDENNELTHGEVFYGVPITETTVISTRVDVDETPTLLVDYDGDGETDSVLEPDDEVVPNGDEDTDGDEDPNGDDTESPLPTDERDYEEYFLPHPRKSTDYDRFMDSAFVKGGLFIDIGAIAAVVLIIVIIIMSVQRKKRRGNIAQQRCYNCGSALNPGATFCPGCGAPAAAQIPNLPVRRGETNKLLVVITVICAVVVAGAAALFILQLNYRSLNDIVYKPVIYLYPERETEVSVSLGIDPERFTVTYPEYNGGWNVVAQPDGTLIDKRDGNEYSYLFWEAGSTHSWSFDDGFLVKSSETAEFLREKLSYMGLTPKEYNEFIVYWLPQLLQNEYNLIRFVGEEYRDEYPLAVSPPPDSLLRVFMVWKEANGNETIAPQELPQFDRQGFAVVEWGGTEVG